jgi:SulP family sulfate permease
MEARSPTAELGRHGAPAWHLFVPKLVTVLRQGYGLADLRQDAVAGLTVAIVALPLAMALAIASGTTPDKGLVTAVVAGFLISALGGSRFQIGGPTGAFVVVVFNVIARHGYDGLVLATLLAGLMLVAAGLARLGTWIKYIPDPVVTGFTSGIAVIIFTSQIRDLLGLSMAKVPADFVEKLGAFWEARATLSPAATGLALAALVTILVLRRYAPKVPGFLVAVVGASVLVWAFGLPVDTIGSRFGGIPSSLPAPAWPVLDLAKTRAVMPDAFTIAFLAGVESLLSAMVADGMTGRRHRSNCELVAQGVANVASALFGGLPATGAIARTATSIRSGARSPVAGMLHAVFLLVAMMAAAPLAVFVPLASLAAVLVVVAWNMSEIHKVRHLMAAPLGDRLVLIATFALTVLVDLTVAIEVGVVLAAVLFMHRMAELVAVQQGASPVDEDEDDLTHPLEESYVQRRGLPEGVEVIKLRGPLFFGAARRIADVLGEIGKPPRVLILRMREVPLVDATGVAALDGLARRCAARGARLVLAGVQDQPRAILDAMGVSTAPGVAYEVDYPTALARASEG